MTRKMIVNAIDTEEVRIAILDSGVLEDFDIETRDVEKNKGNIYKAVVMAVEPALNAAFIDYGADKQGFLTANDVDPRLAGKEDTDAYYRINELLKPKQSILVQVTKDEVSSKGAVLTTYLSLAGRYVVVMPGSARHGVSRKIEDEDTRRRMREAAALLDAPDGIGTIVRTAGKDRSRIELNRDLGVLLRLWENIHKASERTKAPALIFKEQDVVIRALRDYFHDDIDEIVLDSDDAYDRAAEYMHLVMPTHKSVLTRYVERRPIFHHYRIEEQLEALYTPRVTLPSGGSLVIEPTEALVSIDVNSGKQKLGGQEETALQSNLEAAREVARQLKLRDLGGIIVVDFIDMASRRHEQRVEKAIREALSHDKARIKVSRISPNGTLELTRQRIRSALDVSIFRTCEVCHGTGHCLKPEAHGAAVLRKVRDRAARGDLKSAKVRLESSAANHLRTARWSAVQELEQRFSVRLDIIAEHSFGPGQDDFTFETDPNATVVPIEEPNFGPAPRFDDGSDEDVATDEGDRDRDRDRERDEDLEQEEDSRPEEEQAGFVEMQDPETFMEEQRDNRGRPHERSRGGRGGSGGGDDRPRGRHGPRRDERHDGGRGRGDHDEASAATVELGMPSFELVAPEALGMTLMDSDDRKRGRRGGRRRRGRRGEGQPEGAYAGQGQGGGRGGQGRQGGQGAAGAGRGAGAVAPARKPGFFARLFGFGRGKKS